MWDTWAVWVLVWDVHVCSLCTFKPFFVKAAFVAVLGSQWNLYGAAGLRMLPRLLASLVGNGHSEKALADQHSAALRVVALNRRLTGLSWDSQYLLCVLGDICCA